MLTTFNDVNLLKETQRRFAVACMLKIVPRIFLLYYLLLVTVMSSPSSLPLVSYVLATYDRPNELEEALDSILDQAYPQIEIVVVGKTSRRVAQLFDNGQKYDRDWITYRGFSDRKGPAQAKNVGFRLAKGKFIIHIDDDATVADSSATDRVVSLFQSTKDVGVLAFQSRNHDTEEIIPNEIPDPPDFKTPPFEEYRTTFYTGVGTAFRQDALNAAGLYPENFEYGFEEEDLAIRVLNSGYDILYTPSIVVYHKKSPNARRPTLEMLELQIENRIRIAIRNLPWRYVLFTTVIWSMYTILKTRRMASLYRIYHRLFSQRRALLNERNVINSETIKLLKSRHSQLFFWWYGPNPRRIVGKSGDLKRLKW